MRKRQITKLDWVAPLAQPQNLEVVPANTNFEYIALIRSAELQTGFSGMVNFKRILVSWIVEASSVPPVLTVPVYMGIVLKSEGLTGSSPDPELDADDDQWLWWHAAWITPSGLYSRVASAEYGREDIRSNRRAESGQDVSLMVKSPGAEVRFGAAIRYLVGV